MLLLDTCTVLWLSSEQKQIPEHVQKLITDHADSLFVSAISAFEISIKHKKQKLILPLTPHEWFEQVLEFHGLNEIPIDSKIAIDATQLPELHNDPCDRIIIATAERYGLKILTPDILIQKYPDVNWFW